MHHLNQHRRRFEIVQNNFQPPRNHIVGPPGRCESAPNHPQSKFTIPYAIVKYLPKVANRQGLVTPNLSAPWVGRFRCNRAARAYVMGPIVEPQRYLQRRCSKMNVYP